ncbi:hypothetical protein [Ferrimicrobium sp.]|uniref:hypothetical protein n=1 Tax=Ferrimicrobium sp. TaxID=2926050 RepID=UPI00261EAD99|nr:hypothetical protein [Ferrimicrobium sp.]
MKKLLLAIPVGGLLLAACGSTSASNPVSAGAAKLTSQEVHFCFVTQATSGADSTELEGCGDQNYDAHLASANLTSSVTLSGQSQSEKVGVERIGKTEWVYFKKKWYAQKEPFPASSPGSISSLLRATPSVKKVAGIKVLGQSTTGYQGVFTAADFKANKKALTSSMATSLTGLKSDTFTAYVNSKGQVVQVNQTELVTSSSTKVTVTSTVQFSHFGENVAINKPPANEISKGSPT